MIDASMEIELARHQWGEGARALRRASADPAVAAGLARQFEVVNAELARRVGQVFTLAELVAVYQGADRWSLALISDAVPDLPPLQASVVADAAFEFYARRASDYAP